jgi:hypothetical protein
VVTLDDSRPASQCQANDAFAAGLSHMTDYLGWENCLKTTVNTGSLGSLGLNIAWIFNN